VLVVHRKIIHIDMDAFFAAVEERDNPQLKGKPVIVGGQPDSRGVVATCNYEARKYGIHSAMSSVRAGQLCPHGFFVKPRFAAYKEASQKIHQVFRQYTDLIEPLSLDEAYLDVTDVKYLKGSATLIAQEIRQKIYAATKLTASAGISYNKFLAKIASDMNKPDGQFIVKPGEGERFVEALKIGKFYGVGKVTEAKMQAMGIITGADLKSWSKEKLSQVFGKSGVYYYSIARGIDHRPVSNSRIRKSYGAESTFQTDIKEPEEMQQYLESYAQQILEELGKRNTVAYTLTIKVKYTDFQQVTRSKTFDEPVKNDLLLSSVIKSLLDKTDVLTRAVRLLGVSFSNLTKNPEDQHEVQLDLFD
jgi:DNA polymerase IV